jgi:hypothetical protein
MPIPQKPSVLESIKEKTELAASNAAILLSWAQENPWLNETEVHMVLPSSLWIEFKQSSRCILAAKLGASGWIADYSNGNPVKHLPNGIRIEIKRDVVCTLSGEIPESEMLKEAN